MTENTLAALYQLQQADYTTLSNVSFLLAIIDKDDANLTASDITSLQAQNKTLISYLSIGEAEDYRDYWQNNDWDTTPPDFLLEENPNWPGNYNVEFWNPDWQAIIFDKITEIVTLGYDGMYLDIVDAFMVEGVQDAYPGTDAELRLEMQDFVIALSEHAKAINPDFKVIPQNAPELLGQDAGTLAPNEVYLAAIDGLGVEDLFYNDNEVSDFTQGDLEYIQFALDAGKLVLATSYPTDQDKQLEFIQLALAEGLVPFIGNRALDGTIDADNYNILAQLPTELVDQISREDITPDDGSGDDTITGGDGNDTVDGGQGNDTIDGDDGSTSGGDSGDDTVDGGQGNGTVGGDDTRECHRDNDDDDSPDTVNGNQGQDATEGNNDTQQGDHHQDGGHNDDNDAEDDNGHSDNLSDNTLENDWLCDKSGHDDGGDDDTQVAQSENDTTNVSADEEDSHSCDKNHDDNDDDNATLTGTDEDDSLVGDGHEGCITGNAGSDELHGNDDDDTLDGGDDEDLLRGGDGDDVLVGGEDEDTLVGGAGNDIMTGGEDSDQYIIAADSGNDTITDYAIASGRDGDVLVFTSDIFANSADALAAVSYEFGNAVITLANGQTVMLNGVTEGSLTEADFSII
ncbi:MAG: endo alpha-1,4 polygalactosaminidase [Hyphomicrobiales bacterium]|nr:endo alpha-1,4 polygalactosaminidase [Rickettsiales bacterium]MCP5361531.1 endo alpha-1,4 polygalactosaminidase [Hyphomicrobiales bacterium]